MIILQPSVASKRMILHVHCVTSSNEHIYIEILRLIVQNHAEKVLQLSLNPSVGLSSSNHSHGFIRFHLEIQEGSSSLYLTAAPQIVITSIDTLPSQAELNHYRTCEMWQESIVPMNVSNTPDQHAVACTILRTADDWQMNSIQLIESNQWMNEDYWIGLRSQLQRRIPEEPLENLCREHLRLELYMVTIVPDTLVFEFNITRFVSFPFLSLVHPLSSLFTSYDISFLRVYQMIHKLQEDELVILLPIRETIQCSVVLKGYPSVEDIPIKSIPIQLVSTHPEYMTDIGLVFNISLLKRVWNETKNEIKEELLSSRQLREDIQSLNDILQFVRLQ